jgi:hypothetical protein
MAAEGETQTEFVAHERSYEGFISMMKWGGGISLLVAMLWILLVGL